MINKPWLRLFQLAGIGWMIAGWGFVEASVDRPNFLWLTFEDTSASEFACYGNLHTQTPTFDRLAREGIQFMKASSNAPQCSPARSTIISGQYSTTFGTDWHRHDQKVPHEIYYFPKFLRDAGYFCSNSTKRDYNNGETPDWVWDVSDGNASYNHPDRKPDQPFFSVFNANMSHMGRVRSFHIDKRRDFSKEGLDPATLVLPGHLPDLPEIRSDYAFHLEGTQDIDQWIALCLRDLEAKGLADDTIIFVFADHGGCLPRGKGFLFQTGLHIPFVVHFPEKWRHLAGNMSGEVDELVGFVDLAPTVLQLAGIEIPSYFQGKAIFNRSSPAKYQFGLRCNQELHFDPGRSVFDGRFKYIRNFLPHKLYCLRNFYQWGMPANQAWDQWVFAGNQDPVYQSRPVHELYDTASDPFETRNLAQHPEYQGKRVELESALKNHIRQTVDLGFFPQSMREKEVPLYDWVRESSYDMKKVWDLCFLVGTAEASDLPMVLEALNDADPLLNYWASQIVANYGHQEMSKGTIDQLLVLKQHLDPFVSAAASHALVRQGRVAEGLDGLYRRLQMQDSNPAYSHLESLTWSQHREDLKFFLSFRLANEVSLYDVGQPLRSILINLGMLPYSALYPKASYDEGLKVNRHRRPLKPLP